MAQIPQNFIDSVLEKIDIVELIRPRIHLKRSGQNWSGLCPFHQEKTPSFSVSAVKQFFYCFGCHAHGNAIKFLMQYDRLSFIDAITQLANQAGMVIPINENPKAASYKPLYQLLNRLTDYYQQQLINNKTAYDYLIQRGLTDEIIKHYRLGYAPDSWELIQRELKFNAIENKQLSTLGMISISSRETYAKMRQRVMFPIRNIKGDVIAFGGRILNNAINPKYLNSPETPIFHKSNELYGLHEWLKSHSKDDHLIIVEGYMDVIMLAQHGIKNAVATLGTAIGQSHIQKILRYTQNIVICFDGDEAGKKAAWRALTLILPIMHDGISVKFVTLPEKQDPDSFVRAQGKIAFENYVKNSQTIENYLLTQLKTQNDITTISGKARLAETAKKLIAPLANGVFKSLLEQQISQFIGADIQSFNTSFTAEKAQSKAPAVSTACHPLVEHLIKLIVQQPEAVKNIEWPEELGSSENGLAGLELLKKIMEQLRQKDFSHFGQLLGHDEDTSNDWLAKLAAEELILKPEQIVVEITEAFQRLVKVNRDLVIQQLLAKGKREALNDVEKESLRKLLAESHIVV